MRRRLLQAAALALLVCLGTGLVVALVHEPSRGHAERRSLDLRLQPRDPQFGDTVVATLAISGASDVRVRNDFRPYVVVSKSRTAEDEGTTIVYRLRCLELPCVPRGRAQTFRFKPAVVSYAGGRSVRPWPALRVHSRITRADVDAPVLRVPPPVAEPAHYRLAPTTTGIVLLVLAGLFAAAGVGLLLAVGLRRITPARRRIPPLTRVLDELAASCSNGDSGRRRRALEELARQLEPLDEPLSEESRVLAWGPEEPRPEAISDLTSRVKGATGR